jgi:hypothetical protein
MYCAELSQLRQLHFYGEQASAGDNQIGNGTVSEIIKAIKERGSEAGIDIIRETAVMLRGEGLSIDDFAPSIRLKHLSEEKHLNVVLSRHSRMLRTRQKDNGPWK